MLSGLGSCPGMGLSCASSAPPWSDAASLVQLASSSRRRAASPGSAYAYASVSYLGPALESRQRNLTSFLIRRVRHQARRLRASKSRYPYVVLTDRPDVFEHMGLAEMGVSVRPFNRTLRVPCDVKVLLFMGRWADTWSGAYQKLQAFGLDEFSKVLLLDLDVKIMGNLDHLFNLPLPAGGFAGQRDDSICLGEDFDKYVGLPIVGANRSRHQLEGEDLLRHTGYARAVMRLFETYHNRKWYNKSTGWDLLAEGGSKVGRQKLTRSPQDTWNLGLNSGILLLVPNRTDLEGLLRMDELLPTDCSEWWPDGADQVVIAQYFARSSRAWLLPASEASYSHCSFFYATSGYIPTGRTIRALHATCEKYFPELMGAANLLTALGVPKAAHGLLWAHRKASLLWGKAKRLRRKAKRRSARATLEGKK